MNTYLTNGFTVVRDPGGNSFLLKNDERQARGADPEKNLALIMKDGKIYKNTIQ